MTIMKVLLMMVFVLFTTAKATDRVRTCQPIMVEMCKDIGYNVTGMPNLLNHELQRDAQLELQTFTPLIQCGCSSRLKFFLCSVYLPMCTEKVPQVIGPCRPLCEDVRDRCLPVLQKFSYPWPPALNCSKFYPENNAHYMCMPGPKAEEPRMPNSFYDFNNIDKDFAKNSGIGDAQVKNGLGDFNRKPTTKGFVLGDRSNLPFFPILRSKAPTKPTANPLNYHFGMCDKYKKKHVYYYDNHTERCSQLCLQDNNFTQKEKDLVEVWMGILSVFCFISTFITFVTFMLGSKKIHFPEKSVNYICFCYCIYSLGFIVRLGVGRENVSCQMENEWTNVQLLIQDGLENSTCTTVSMLVYFFATASAFWWAIFAVTWFMSAGMKPTHEVAECKVTCYHFVSWSFPASLIIIALLMRAVDADELTGMCSVGNQSSRNLLIFVIVPQAACLVIGTLILLAGFRRLWKSRHNHHIYKRTKSYSNQPVDMMDVYMIRVFIFSLCYFIPSASVLGCYLYEYAYREEWLTKHDSKPILGVFCFRIFMSLLVGIVSGPLIYFDSIATTWKSWFGRGSKSKSAAKNPMTIREPHHRVLVVSHPRKMKPKNGHVTMV